MNELPRKKLSQIIRQYGVSVCDNPLCLEGLLKDHCGGYRREVFVLTCALKEKIVSSLLASKNGVPMGILRNQCITRLKDSCALSEDAARWAVDSWALALGVITENDLSKGNEHKPERKVVQQQRSTAPQSKGFLRDGLLWEGNSRLIFNTIVETAPKPFRVMTEKKLREAIAKRVDNSKIVTEDILIECIKEITPKPFVPMFLKSIEHLRTTSDTRMDSLLWEASSRYIFDKLTKMFPSPMSDMARTRLLEELRKRVNGKERVTEKMVIEGFKKVTSGSFFMDAFNVIKESRKV